MTVMRGPIYFNKKLIEEEVKFYIDLTLAINSVKGKTGFQEGAKKGIINKLSAEAAEGIYNSLGLKDYATPSGWTVTSSGRRIKQVIDKDDPNDIILDCSVDEFIDKGYGPVKMDVSNKVTGHNSIILEGIPDKINMLKAAKEAMMKEVEKATKPSKKAKNKEVGDAKIIFADKPIKKPIDPLITMEAKKKVVKSTAKKSKKAKAIKKAVKKVKPKNKKG